MTPVTCGPNTSANDKVFRSCIWLRLTIGRGRICLWADAPSKKPQLFFPPRLRMETMLPYNRLHRQQPLADPNDYSRVIEPEPAINAQSEEVRRKAAKDLFEAYAGKPSQAHLDASRNEQRTLTIRWLPPPNDKSVAIQPEPD